MPRKAKLIPRNFIVENIDSQFRLEEYGVLDHWTKVYYIPGILQVSIRKYTENEKKNKGLGQDTP